MRVEGIDLTRQKLRKIADDAGRNALGSIKAGGAVLIDGMRSRAPDLSGDYEGSMARSIHMRSDGPTAVLVGTNHGLARVFEDGGEITTSRKQTLADGDTVFGPRVVIPAQSFVRRTMDEDRIKALAAAKASAARRFQPR